MDVVVAFADLLWWGRGGIKGLKGAGDLVLLYISLGY